MDRNIVYPGSIPLDTDVLSLNRNAMIAVSALSQAVFGNNVVVDGLEFMPTEPPSLTISIAPGSITAFTLLDTNSYGTLAASTVEQIIKMGINLQTVSFTFVAPPNSGQSINYLIEATFIEADGNPVVLPYVNAANPALPYSGPNNSGGAQNTVRNQRVQLQVKPGAAASAGTQTTPAVDNGWTGLYVVTVNYGQSAITSGNVVTLPTAPFLQFKLPSLRPGFSSLAVYNNSGNFIVPAGVNTALVRVIGGGGAAGYHATLPGAGGGAGGEAMDIFTSLTPGQLIPVVVGIGGVAAATPANGAPGGTSSFGTFASATGGQGGQGGSGTLFATAGGLGGIGVGARIIQGGAMGADGIAIASRGGDGAGPGHGRGASGPLSGFNATGFGGGGGGGGASGGSSPVGSPGGSGAPGLVIIEF